MTTTKTLRAEDLHQFTGSEHWYRHWCNRKVTFTDGVKYVAEAGGAFWLIDEIAILQPHEPTVGAEEFQVWQLRVRSDRSGLLSCENGNGSVVYAKEITSTDFPLDEITLYFANNVIYLPSEH